MIGRLRALAGRLVRPRKASVPPNQDAGFARLRADTIAILQRFEEDRTRPEDLIAPGDVRVGCDPAWVPEMLSRSVPHDADYAVFRHFAPRHGTILDVGANWGYSAGSIRAVGCACPILSIEVIEAFGACLAEVKRILGQDYDFVICGAGSEAAERRFRTPVVNGAGIDALCSAEKLMQLTPRIVDDIVAHTKTYLPRAASAIYEIKLSVVEAVVKTLDQILRDYAGPVPVENIAAIKIDVEGLEAAVLAGSAATIMASRPFLLIEGGNRPPGVREKLANLGYQVAERQGDQLCRSDGESREINGLFYHPAQAAEYLAIGLLRG